MTAALEVLRSDWHTWPAALLLAVLVALWVHLLLGTDE